MAKRCRAFRMDDPKEAAKHIEQNWEQIEGYGDSRYGNELYVWDDGGRSLGRCRECGAFILRQYSSYHGMESDGHYTDFFPVADAAEADGLNRRYDGYAIERHFPRRYLMETNGNYSWSSHAVEEPET